MPKDKSDRTDVWKDLSRKFLAKRATHLNDDDGLDHCPPDSYLPPSPQRAYRCDGHEASRAGKVRTVSKDEEQKPAPESADVPPDDGPAKAPAEPPIDEAVRAAAAAALKTTAAVKHNAEIQARLSDPNFVTDEDVRAMIAQAKSKLPRVCEVLTKNGLSGWQLDGRILHLASLPFEEDAILSLIDEQEAPPGELVTQPKYSPARRQFEIIRHSVVRWWNRKGKIGRLFYMAAWAAALIGPSIQKGLTLIGGIGIVFVVGLRLRAQYKDLDHHDREIVDPNQRRRLLQLEACIAKMQRWMRRAPTPDELFDFQREVLGMINSYVRDHRSDREGKRIYTNLLIRSGNAVAVIARSDLRRKVPELYTSDECCHAWITLTSGAPEYTGDVYKSAPKTRKGKRYNSVIVLPIKREDRVLGAVSIDSEGMFHFDSVFTELQSDLAPFVQLLAITLTEDHDNGQRELTDGEEHGGDAGDSRPRS